MKQLTIITINRNNGPGLEKTILSVVNQTWKDYEYIVVDGASSDNSVEIINKYLDNITYWVSEPDTGIYNAMNKGVKQATGKYCLFLNSGDCLTMNNVLEDVFKEKHTEDIIYGPQLRQGKRGNRVIEFPEKLTFFHFYAEFIGHNCTFIKRNLFDIIGLYNEKNKIVSDMEFLMLAVCKFNCSTRYIKQIVSVMEDGGISNDFENHELVLKERRKVLKKHFPAFISDYE
ncbi:glycosyltransferase family 2 protein, partial [Thermodesulfobacteriota bacterium]